MTHDMGVGPSPLPSIDKALRTLLVLADFGQSGAALGRIADSLDLKKSSLHATLAALRHRGFVTQDGKSGFYRLGPEVERLARSWLEDVDIRSILRPTIRRLADELNEVIHVAVPDGTEVIYIDKAESRQPIQAGTAVGLRLPAVTTALGRSMIAAEYDNLASFAIRYSGSWTPRTQFAPTSIEEAWQRIEQARQSGFAVDSQENVLGLAAIAIAILRGNTPVAAVSVVTLTSLTATGGAPLEHLGMLRSYVAAALPAPYVLASPIE